MRDICYAMGRLKKCGCGGKLIELVNEKHILAKQINFEPSETISFIESTGMEVCEDCRLVYFIPEHNKEISEVNHD